MAINDDIQDEAIKHAIFLERLRNKEVNKILATLNDDVLPDVEKEINRRLRRNMSADRFIRMRKAYTILLREGYKGLGVDLKSDLLDIANNEAENQIRIINKNSPISLALTVPSQAVMRQIVNGKVRGQTIKKYFNQYADRDANEITRRLSIGLAEGDSIPDMTRRIVGTKAQGFSDGVFNGTRHNAQTLVRTSVTEVTVKAREATYEANSDVIDKVKYVATLDSRTTPICASLDGEVFPIGEGPRPPQHFNALVGGTLITTKKGLTPIEDVKVGDEVLTHLNRWKKVYTVMAKSHNGKIKKLKTSFNTCVSLTDDHPILTKTRGWLNARDVCTGDVLFQNFEKFTKMPMAVGVSSVITQAVLTNSHNMPTKCIEDLIPYSISSFSAGMSSTVNLKDNFTKSKISNTTPDRFLKTKYYTPALKYFNKCRFMSCWIFTIIISTCFKNFFFSAFIKHWVRLLHSCRTLFSKLFTFFDILFSPMVSTRCPLKMAISVPTSNTLGSGACLNSQAFATTLHNSFTYPKFSFNLSKRFTQFPVLSFNNFFKFFFSERSHNSPSNWFASSSISNVDEYYNGYVYNLAVVDDETYLANGLLVHNCRSTTVPVIKSFEDLGIPGLNELPPSTRASASDTFKGQVPATQTYPQWLRNQSKATQQMALGKERSALFRRGKLNDKFFFNDKTKQLTLPQMRAAEAKLD